MTCAEVFSYALLLKGEGRRARIMDLLEEGKQEEVRAVLERLTETSPDAIRQLWREQRVADELSMPAGA